MTNTPARAKVLNAISIDVEGFIEANLQSFAIARRYKNPAHENREIEANVHAVLHTLHEFDVRATFFFLGRIARDLPHVVKEVAEAGHEIGCHSYDHIRIFTMGRDEFKQKVKFAKHYLEDVSGKPVYGFRAPDFSITRSSLWALDVLKESDFQYDSSIYPIGIHDVYGIEGTKPYIHELPNGLIEFPPSTVSCLGKRVPVGGGGYFRLYPTFVTNLCIARMNRLGQPCMFYIHPYEVGPAIPRVGGLSPYRKFRHYHNCGNGGQRLKRILRVFRFGPAFDVLRHATSGRGV
jgi:polysaccharide deacetylase family protein (PEP-CTERM system associated)